MKNIRLLIILSLMYCNPIFADIHDDLISAVKKYDKARVEVLLKKGAYVNVMDETGGTPLYIAAAFGRMEILKLLLNSGADIDRGRPNGVTPLMIALLRDRKEVVKFLIAKNANLKGRVTNGINILMLASMVGNLDLIKRALVAGLNVNAKDIHGDTALHYCVATPTGIEKCKLDIVKYLVSKGANINAKSKRRISTRVKSKTSIDSYSLLEQATSYGRLDIVKYLLEQKVAFNPSCKASGHNALQQAVLYNKPELVEYLVSSKKYNLKDKCIFDALVKMSKKGKVKIVKAVLTKDYSSVLTVLQKNKLLLSGISSGDEKHLKFLVESTLLNKSSFNKLDDYKKEQVLIAALDATDSKILEFMLVSKIIDTSTRLKGKLLIDQATNKGREVAYAYLIQKGFKPGRKAVGEYIRRLVFSKDRKLPSRKRVAILRKLINTGSASYIDVSTGDTFLTLLAGFNDISLAKLVIKKDKKLVNVANKEGQTPLMSAAKKGDLALTKLLLASGAKPLEMNKSGKTALVIALESGKTAIAKTLLTQKFDVESKVYIRGKGSVSLGVFAAKEREPVITQIILARKKRISIKEASQLLYFCVRYNYLDLLKSVLAKSSAVNNVARPFVRNKYALDIAVEYNRYAMVPLLLNKKARFYDGNIGITKLIKFVGSGKSDLLKIFIARGLDVNQNHNIKIRGQNIRSSLLNYSLDNRKANVAKMLLKVGANPNLWDSKGKTAIFYTQSESLLKTVMNAGGDINHEDKLGQTVLSVAIEQSNLSRAKMLLKVGANPNKGYAKSGATLIMLAAWNEKPKIVRLLLEHGADPKAQPSNPRMQFKNAFEVAEKTNNANIKRLLKAVSSKP